MPLSSRCKIGFIGLGVVCFGFFFLPFVIHLTLCSYHILYFTLHLLRSKSIRTLVLQTYSVYSNTNTAQQENYQSSPWMPQKTLGLHENAALFWCSKPTISWVHNLSFSNINAVLVLKQIVADYGLFVQYNCTTSWWKSELLYISRYSTCTKPHYYDIE